MATKRTFTPGDKVMVNTSWRKKSATYNHWKEHVVVSVNQTRTSVYAQRMTTYIRTRPEAATDGIGLSVSDNRLNILTIEEWAVIGPRLQQIDNDLKAKREQHILEKRQNREQCAASILAALKSRRSQKEKVGFIADVLEVHSFNLEGWLKNHA